MLICLSYVSTVSSQEASKVVKVEPQLSDIYNVLELMDINLFRFDLNTFLNEKYTMSIFIDEYVNNKKTKRVFITKLGDNIQSLDDIPEKHRDGFRKLKKVPEGKNEWDNIKEVSVYIRKKNDTTAIFSIDVPDVMRFNRQVFLRPVGEQKTYFYHTRPFSFQEIKNDEKDNMEIPVILYGSGWLDTKYNVIRFCGEREIDPEMKANILKDIPHHYILGLQLQKAKVANIESNRIKE